MPLACRAEQEQGHRGPGLVSLKNSEANLHSNRVIQSAAGLGLCSSQDRTLLHEKSYPQDNLIEEGSQDPSYICSDPRCEGTEACSSSGWRSIQARMLL